ncbi:protein containing GCN5-related N-acetyltransferase domain protein [human gut metagenome]|uniref:Protein containing GCN5-related N-acetyltransferase domain protein n=1 Tax=human gut metagenome TaxID=408170 RepID=K1RPS1_9ZZZZ
MAKTVKRKDYFELMLKWKMFGECFVAIKDEIMGYCIIYANDCIGKVAYITMIGVRPEYQGKHIGYKLLTRICEYSIVKGMDAVELEVLIANFKALEFYKSFGFKVVGRKKILKS